MDPEHYARITLLLLLAFLAAYMSVYLMPGCPRLERRGEVAVWCSDNQLGCRGYK